MMRKQKPVGWTLVVVLPMLMLLVGCRSLGSLFYAEIQGPSKLPPQPEPSVLLEEKSARLLEYSEQVADEIYHTGVEASAPGILQTADAVRAGRGLLGEPAKPLPHPDLIRRLPEVDEEIEAVQKNLAILHEAEANFAKSYDEQRIKAAKRSFTIGSGVLNQILIYGGLTSLAGVAVWILKNLKKWKGGALGLIAGIQEVRERSKNIEMDDDDIKDVLRAHQDEWLQRFVKKAKSTLK